MRSSKPHEESADWSSLPVHVLAYAAGVIDSDGSVCIQRETYAMRVLGRATQPTFSERVVIRQIEPEAIDFLHGHFGGSRGVIRYRESKRKQQPMQSLTIADRKASRVLAAVVPYLRIKRRQAELCLEMRRLKEESHKARFALGRGHRGAGRRPESISVAMEAVHAEMAKENRVADRAARHNPSQRVA